MRLYLSDQDLIKVVNALVCPQLDYCSTLYCDITAARLNTSTRRFDRITPFIFSFTSLATGYI